LYLAASVSGLGSVCLLAGDNLILGSHYLALVQVTGRWMNISLENDYTLSNGLPATGNKKK
jgi:hypothetical protein